MPEKKNSVTLKDIAHDVHRDSPHIASKGEVEHLLDSAFKIILERVAKGSEVKIRGFGNFNAKVFKGRELKSPLMKGGSISFEDQLVLRFQQSQAAKKEINTIAEKYSGSVSSSAVSEEPAEEKPAEEKPKKGGKKAAAKGKAKGGKKGSKK